MRLKRSTRFRIVLRAVYRKEEKYLTVAKLEGLWWGKEPFGGIERRVYRSFGRWSLRK